MEIPILIEPVAGNGFRARGGEPFRLAAEGSTAEEALQNPHQLIKAQLVAGARVVPLELPTAEHLLAPFAGMFKDDPLFDEWQQAIADYHRAAGWHALRGLRACHPGVRGRSPGRRYDLTGGRGVGQGKRKEAIAQTRRSARMPVAAGVGSGRLAASGLRAAAEPSTTPVSLKRVVVRAPFGGA
jgi:hypothetical protein